MATFPNVTEDFSLQNLVFTRPCYKCGVPEQRSRLLFDRCVLFYQCYPDAMMFGAYEDCLQFRLIVKCRFKIGLLSYEVRVFKIFLNLS